MEAWKYKMPVYLIVVMLSVLSAFATDHYLLGDKMGVFPGLAIGIGPVFLLMLADIFIKDKQ